MLSSLKEGQSEKARLRKLRLSSCTGNPRSNQGANAKDAYIGRKAAWLQESQSRKQKHGRNICIYVNISTPQEKKKCF